MEMPVALKHDWTEFLSKEELKEFKDDKLPEKIVAPKWFDMSKAKKIEITSDDIEAVQKQHAKENSRDDEMEDNA